MPLRIEIGPRDIAENKCVMVTRTKREKTFVSLDELEASVDERLRTVRDEMYEKALENRSRRSYDCTSIEEIGKAVAEHGDGFAFAMWCGSEECEDKVKELVCLVDQPIDRTRFTLRSSQSEKDLGQVRLLRKARRQDGLLGQGILIFALSRARLKFRRR